MNLQEMRDMDIRKMNPADAVDIADISVNMDLPVNERIIDTAKQMNGNPYFFRHGKTLVKVGHIQTDVTINDRCESYLRTL